MNFENVAKRIPTTLKKFLGNWSKRFINTTESFLDKWNFRKLETNLKKFMIFGQINQLIFAENSYVTSFF